MIGKLAVSGGGFAGLCRYVMRERPQDLRRLERDGVKPDDARIVGGTLAGNNAYALTQELEWAAALNPDVSKPVFHASLRLPEHESGRLNDRAWGEIGREYAERMGFGDAPYVVVCHGRDHAHIVASRVDLDGGRVPDWKDRYRSQEILRDIERQRGLEHPRERDHEREPETTREVERRELREAIDRAIRAGDGSREAFDQALEQEGVRADWKTSNRDGSIVGVRFVREDDEYDRGYKGSQLGKDYGGRALEERIAERDRARELEHAREQERYEGRGHERERSRDDDWGWER
jgi:hypothetical protein